MGWRNKYAKFLELLNIERASDELAREQFRILTSQVPILYGIILINALFMALVIYEYAGFYNSFIFPIIIIPLVMIRATIWLLRSKKANNERFNDIKYIRKVFRGNIIAANFFALVLAAWCINLLFVLPTEYTLYVPLFAILSMISCAYCLMSLPMAAYSVLLSGSTMIAIAMAITGQAKLIAMSANVFIISALIIYMVSKQYRQLKGLIESRSKMIEQRAYANELAHHDQLTGLPNRRALVESLYKIAAERPDHPIAVIMIDLNGFKPVNDTYGHAAGDSLLITIGRRLKKVMNRDGLLARLGGDEFAAILYDPKNIDTVYRRAELLLHAIIRPLKLEDHELRIGAAVGIATKTQMTDNPLEILQHADIALYESKAKDGTNISIFEGQMEARVIRRTMIEQALSDKAQMAGITVNYQPIFSLEKGEHVGFEALARWEHETLGTVSPTEFVEAAERKGLATRLTIHLFQQALETAKLWDDKLFLSFNLSGSGIGTSGLDKILPETLEKMNFPAHRLSVEVTETALLSDLDAARSVLETLQGIGIKIALDDFGAGYASIGYLREMKFDSIKLDGSLISDIITNRKSRELLIGVLHLCQSIGAKVTAEMVENEAQLALLRTLPIENVQGYLLGRPVAKSNTFKQDEDKHQKREKLFA